MTSFIANINRVIHRQIFQSSFSVRIAFPFVLVLNIVGLPVLALNPVYAQTAESGDVASAVHRLNLGLQLYQQGALEDASVQLDKAVDVFAKKQQPLLQIDGLTALAHVYRALGYHSKAVQRLDLAFVLSQKVADRGRQAGVMGALGQVYLEAGRYDAASDFLDQGLAIAREGNDTTRMAIILNEQGRLSLLQGNDEKALRNFNESQVQAESIGLQQLRNAASLNATQIYLKHERYGETQYGLERAIEETRTMPNSHDKAYALISLGLMFQKLGRAEQANTSDYDLKAADIFEEAGIVGKSIGDQRAMSYAFGYRGRVYERHGRSEEALMLTRLAVASAHQVHAPESLYLWQWQTGRIMRAMEQPEKAIDAYQRASQTLTSLQPELTYSSSHQGSFQQSNGSLFYEFADLLLEQARAVSDQKRGQAYLFRARQVIELNKTAELRDYFRDDCVDALQERRTNIDDLPRISPRTAIIYPILLKERTELLVSLPQGIRQVTVPIGQEQIVSTTRMFRRLLEKRTTREFLPHAQQLYGWLLRPLEADLTEFSIDTLVIVPDGVLRTIPLSALHDGKQFLIEKYAVATTPGLDLTDPRPLKRENVNVLSAGLTEGVQGYPPLPNVIEEINALERLYGSEALLDKAFLTSSLEKEMRSQDFTIVHIASHAEFMNQVGDSYLLTFDDKLTMDQLNQAVGYFRFREQPLELLTLSACETAAGDDRAALGLAGIAIKAGARSALATLWFINDQASSKLVAEFYKHLGNVALSKAKALQLAQITLMKNPLYQHPSHWAPFLLLNNWL